MTYLLNTPILTNYGRFEFSGPLELDDARALLTRGATSAIGHTATAKLMSKLLGHPVQVARRQVRMQPGDKALVFRLLKRQPEGSVLDEHALAALPHEFALLRRIA